MHSNTVTETWTYETEGALEFRDLLAQLLVGTSYIQEIIQSVS